MTKSFATNGDNDLALGVDGNLLLLGGAQAVANVCTNVAQGQLGEMMFATDRGLPNFDLAWIGSPNVSQWQGRLRAALLRVDGVVTVLDLTVQRVGQALTYRATIKTIYGEVSIGG